MKTTTNVDQLLRDLGLDQPLRAERRTETVITLDGSTVKASLDTAAQFCRPRREPKADDLFVSPW